MAEQTEAIGVDVIALTKRLAGREFLPVVKERGDAPVVRWVRKTIGSSSGDDGVLTPAVVEAAELYLDGIDGKVAAAELGISRPGYYQRLKILFQVLRTRLGLESPAARARLFVSVYDRAFSDEVTAAELATVLLGRPSNVPQMEWVRKVRAGVVNGLALPRVEEGRYVWTRPQAEAYRDAYVNGALFEGSLPHRYAERSPEGGVPVPV